MAYFRCGRKALFYKGLREVLELKRVYSDTPLHSYIFMENNNNRQLKRLFKLKSKGRTRKKVGKECDRGKVGFLGTNVVI